VRRCLINVLTRQCPLGDHIARRLYRSRWSEQERCVSSRLCSIISFACSVVVLAEHMSATGVPTNDV
jgi:hypothetical protein